MPPPPRETPLAAPAKLSPEVEERRTSLKPVDGVPLATISPRKRGGASAARTRPSSRHRRRRRTSSSRAAPRASAWPATMRRCPGSRARRSCARRSGTGRRPSSTGPAARASLKRVVRDDARRFLRQEPPIRRRAIGKETAPPPTRPTAPSLDEMEAEVARERGEARLREAVAAAKAERAAAERVAAEEAERARLEAERLEAERVAAERILAEKRARLSGWRRARCRRTSGGRAVGCGGERQRLELKG